MPEINADTQPPSEATLGPAPELNPEPTPAAPFEHIAVEPLHQYFAARVTGVDLREPLEGERLAEVRRAFDEYSVLVFPEQRIGDAEQERFSRYFGDLEWMLKGSAGQATPFARITNVDPDTDTIYAEDDPRLRRQYSNELWHTDSSFKRVSAAASLLHAREVPPVGGDTSFASMRAAWNALPEERKALCKALIAEHNFAYSRSLTVGQDFLSAEQLAEVPPVPQALSVVNPRNGKRALYLASHASHILGWPLEQGRALIAELMAHATRAEFVYRHGWQQWDLVMWDNRATMHSAGGYDYRGHRRVMTRTTVAGASPTVAEAAFAAAEATASPRS